MTQRKESDIDDNTGIPRQRIYTWYNEHPAGPGPGLLNGLTLAVKDLFDIAGLPTGAGNPDWQRTHPVPERTAPAVAGLLAEGAVLRGKTITDELAYSLNGVNRHYGTPPNPKAPERLPGGSSSGSAAAVALGEADIGLGTDTGGSIRVPAAYCGLYGLRTSHGAVSRDGVVPLAPRFDTVGWMTSDLDVMERVNRVLLSGQSPSAVDHLVVIQPDIDGEVLWREHHEQWLAAVRHRFRHVRELPVPGDWWQRAAECFRILQGRQIWAIHGDWIESTRPDMADDIRERLVMCATLTAAEQRRAEAECEALRHDILTRWLPGTGAVAVLPTTPGPAPRLDAGGDWLKGYRRRLLGLTAPAGLAGLPQLHLPLDPAPPQGISLLGPPGTDRTLTALAAARDPAAGVR